MGPGKPVTIAFGQSDQESSRPADGMISFEGGGRRLTARLIGAEFIRYQSRFPASFEATAELAAGPFIEAVRRVSLVADRLTPVQLAFRRDVLVIEAQSDGRARAVESVPVAFAGSQQTISFNPHYLLDGLTAAALSGQGRPSAAVDADAAAQSDVGRIRLEFTSPAKPALISWIESDATAGAGEDDPSDQDSAQPEGNGAADASLDSASQTAPGRATAGAGGHGSVPLPGRSASGADRRLIARSVCTVGPSRRSAVSPTGTPTQRPAGDQGGIRALGASAARAAEDASEQAADDREDRHEQTEAARQREAHADQDDVVDEEPGSDGGQQGRECSDAVPRSRLDRWLPVQSCPVQFCPAQFCAHWPPGQLAATAPLAADPLASSGPGLVRWLGSGPPPDRTCGRSLVRRLRSRWVLAAKTASSRWLNSSSVRRPCA